MKRSYRYLRAATVMVGLLTLVPEIGCLSTGEFPVEYLRSFDLSWTGNDPDRCRSMAKMALEKMPESPDCALRCLETCGLSFTLPTSMKKNPRVLEKELELQWRQELGDSRLDARLQSWIKISTENALPKYLLVEFMIEHGEGGEAVKILRGIKSPRIVFPHCRFPDKSNISFVPHTGVPERMWHQPIPVGLLKYWYLSEVGSEGHQFGGYMLELSKHLPSLSHGQGWLTPKEVVDCTVTLALSMMTSASDPVDPSNISYGKAVLDIMLNDGSMAEWWRNHITRKHQIRHAAQCIHKKTMDIFRQIWAEYPEDKDNILALTLACRASDPVERMRTAILRVVKQYTSMLVE